MSFQVSAEKNPTQYTQVNPINFTRAAIVGGIAISFGYFHPTSFMGYLGTTIAGITGAVLSKTITSTAYNTYNKWSHKITGPLLVDQKTKEYETFCAAAFERITQHPHYALFKDMYGYKSDDLAYQLFFKAHLTQGYCFGSVVNLLEAIEKKPESSCLELKKLMDIETIFYNQFQHELLAGYQAKEASVRKRLWHEESCRNFSFSPSFTNEYHPMNNKYPEGSSTTNPDLFKLGQHFQHIIAELNKNIIPYNELECPFFSAKESPEIYKKNLEMLIHSQTTSGNNKNVSGRIIISGDDEDKKNGRLGHTFAFQFCHGKFRYYDTINDFDGGFFEYTNKTEFYQAIKKQILDDMPSGYNKILVKFCIKKTDDRAPFTGR